MVTNSSQAINLFFHKIVKSKRNIIRSSGLIFIFAWLFETNFVDLLKNNLKEMRVLKRSQYFLWELISGIILHILDGDRRFSHYKRNPSSVFFEKIFAAKKDPNSSTYLKALKSHPLLFKCLRKILAKQAFQEIKTYCTKNNIKKITIDVDQTARELYGKQEKVAKGYSAGKRNSKLYQIRIYTIRELKIILDLTLLAGQRHSAFDFENEIERITKMLKGTGITVLFVGDSGFENISVCDLIDKNDHYFIFARSQRATVRKRGKFSKNKKLHNSGKTEIKERVGSRSNYREIFVKVLSNDGQLWFDFASDRFTNVFVTNHYYKANNIYRSYKAHAMIETIIEEVKNDFNAGLAHCNVFHVNASMSLCSALAYNIKNTIISRHNLFIKQKQKMKLSTLQSLWIHTPGILVKQGNRKVLQVSAERFSIFEKLKVT